MWTCFSITTETKEKHHRPKYNQPKKTPKPKHKNESTHGQNIIERSQMTHVNSLVEGQLSYIDIKTNTQRSISNKKDI